VNIKTDKLLLFCLQVSYVLSSKCCLLHFNSFILFYLCTLCLAQQV